MTSDKKLLQINTSPSGNWSPLKGHTYLHKPLAEGIPIPYLLKTLVNIWFSGIIKYEHCPETDFNGARLVALPLKYSNLGKSFVRFCFLFQGV